MRESCSVVAIAWVFFRAQDFQAAIQYLNSLVNIRLRYVPVPVRLLTPIETKAWLALGAAILFSFPIGKFLKGWLGKNADSKTVAIVIDLALLALFVLSMLVSIGTTFTTFMYENF